MTLDTAHTDPEHQAAEHQVTAHADGEQHGLSDRGYVRIFIALAIITGLEVAASYTPALGRAFVPILLVLMAIKFVMVLLYFMHLKFDSGLFSVFFYMGLLLAIAVYVAALVTFQFFAP